jgi:DNA-binding transcriptional LysR family regulator
MSEPASARDISLAGGARGLFDGCSTSLQAEPRGLLRINAPMSFGTLHLGPALAEFMEKYPELEMQLTLSDEQIHAV